MLCRLHAGTGRFGWFTNFTRKIFVAKKEKQEEKPRETAVEFLASLASEESRDELTRAGFRVV